MRRVALLIAFLLSACGPGGGTYCQSGPRYGTQCYTQNDVSGGPTPTHGGEDSPRKGEPPAKPPKGMPQW